MKQLLGYWFLFLIICISSTSSIKAQKVYSLKECIDIAIQNNFTIQQNRFQEERGQIYWQQSKLNVLPNVSGNINQGLNLGRSIDPFTNSYTTQEINSTSVGLNAGMTLFNGFSLQSTIKQRALNWEALEQSVEDQKDKIALQVVLAYLQLLTNQELLDQAKNQLSVSAEQLRRMEVLNETGAVKPSDYADVKGQFHNDEVAIARTENNIKTSKLELCRLLNIPYSDSFEVEKMDPTEGLLAKDLSSEEIYQRSLDYIPSVKAAALNEKSTEWFVKAERGRLWPTLRLGANVNTNYSSIAANNTLINSNIVSSDDYIDVNGTRYNVYKTEKEYESNKIPYFDQIKNNRYTTVFLSLQIPLFNNLLQRNNLRLAKIDLKEATARTQTMKTALQIEIEQAWQNQKTSIKEFVSMQQQVNAYEMSFQAATARFNEGVGNSIDYLTTKNNLDRVNSNLIITKYTLLLRTKILEYYEGNKIW